MANTSDTRQHATLDDFFLACKNFWGKVIHFPPPYYLLKVGISSHTPIPLLRPGSFHSGSAS